MFPPVPALVPNHRWLFSMVPLLSVPDLPKSTQCGTRCNPTSNRSNPAPNQTNVPQIEQILAQINECFAISKPTSPRCCVCFSRSGDAMNSLMRRHVAARPARGAMVESCRPQGGRSERWRGAERPHAAWIGEHDCRPRCIGRGRALLPR